MSARSWWGGRAAPKPAESRKKKGEASSDDLLDPRADEGRASTSSRGGRRGAERPERGPAGADVDELDLAVRKLSAGLEALERESRQASVGAADVSGTSADDVEGTRDQVSHSLDRLEARLEALSHRLQHRAGTAPAGTPTGATMRPEPALRPSTADIQQQLAEARRLAEAEVRRAAAIDDSEDEPAATLSERAADDVGEIRRQRKIAEARQAVEATEARRQSELAEARRVADEMESRRQAELADNAEVRRRQFEEAESIRQADLAEARRHAEELETKLREGDEARRMAEIAAARRQTEQAAALERQFAIIEGRIDSVQRGLDENRVEPVRLELVELVKQMTELSRGGRSASEGLDQIGARLDEMELKLHASRNLANSRLGEIQDKLSGVGKRLNELEVEIPGFDAVRENQGAILERFDRMEGLVQQSAAPTELLDRVEGLKRQVQTVASEQAVMRVEAQLLKLADRVDALPSDLAGLDVVQRIEGQLGGFATEFVEARRQRKAVATELERYLSEISDQLREVGETGRTPDLSGVEGRLAALTARLADDRQFSANMFSRFERSLALLADAIETQETAILGGLTQKIDALGDMRHDVASIDGKLTQLFDQVATQGHMEPLKARLDRVQGNLEELGRRAQDSNALFRPFLLKMQEISDRLSVLGAEGTQTPLAERLDTIQERVSTSRGPDARALQTQLDGVISRLELLKGRSIDPGRMNDLFDRVEAAVRALPEERFDRIEQKLNEAMIPLDRIERLERKLGEGFQGASSERVAQLERRLEEVSRVIGTGVEHLTQEDLGEFRADILALRRELRSSPPAAPMQIDSGLTEMVRALTKRVEAFTQARPITNADLEAQMARIARSFADPGQNRSSLAQIENSLRSIERQLEQPRAGYEPSMPRAEGLSFAAPDTDLAEPTQPEDVPTLRISPEAVETKPDESMEAVQDTLEAVVKRMAFLERDADRASAPAEPEEIPAPAPAPRALQPNPEDQPPASLLSRLTSRQLLKRATGGRAESFSPEIEESSDSSDFPLEPGTDSPLSSALSDAPSSDTEFMSGARKGRLASNFVGSPDRTSGSDAPSGDEDFLSAARRAARAASAEAGDPGRGEAKRGLFSTGRRRFLLAIILIAILAVAATQIVRLQLWPLNSEIVASLGGGSSPAETTPDSVVTAPEATTEAPPVTTESTPTEAPEQQAAAPAETPAEVPAPTPTEQAATPAPEQPVAEAAAATDEATPPPEDSPASETATAATAPEAAAATPEVTPPAPEANVASVSPTETPETAPTATPAPAAPQDVLPLAIGPERLRQEATAGNAIAAFEVAARYAEGRGVSPDMTAAIAWYIRSGDAGLAPAQYRLGSIYEKGLGVPRDPAKAQQWYARAAAAGNVKAMHNLAVLYAEGAGGAPDLEKASQLFKEAAEHGVRDSQFNLAILHARGLGVPQDLVEAYKWFAIAASSGDEESTKRADIIAQALSPSDLEAAKAAAASFQPLPLVAGANEVQMPDDGWGEDNSSSVGPEAQNQLVALVQRLLSENGYDPGPADGLLGQRTIDAIAEFQTKAGLPRTGQIDDKTVTALQSPST